MQMSSPRSSRCSCFSWGFGKYGQLGNGASGNCELPQLVRVPSSFKPTALSCGGHFTAIIGYTKTKSTASSAETLPGQVLTCGWGKYGRLGSGSEEDKLVPSETSGALDVVSVSAGHWHACCVSRDGQLYSWGYNKQHGVLGRDGPDTDAIPKPIPAPSGMRFSQVACGYNYTIVVSEVGVVFTWGSGKYGALGHGDTRDRPSPTAVEGLSKHRVISVSAGYGHSAMVDEGGKLFVCGQGSEGALGQGKDHSDKLQPTLVDSLVQQGLTIAQASCSQGEHHAHTLACTNEGEVWSWGDGYKGKLGLGHQESKDTPTKIDSAHFSSAVTQVACGGIHSTAVTERGEVFTWGCGSDGRLGHPDAKGHRYLFRSDVPRRVDFLTSDWRALQVSCSYYHTAVLCEKK